MLLRRWLPSLLLAAALTCGTSARADSPAPATAQLRIDFLSVGQGDAALVTSPAGKTVLIDGGPREAGPKLTALLRERKTTAIDLVLLTHPHEDHLGGLTAVVRAFEVRMFMAGPSQHDSQVYQRLLDTLDERKILFRNAERNRTIDIGGGATVTLLSPPDPAITHSRSDVNANSVIVRIDYREIGVLFAADAEPQTERWLLTSGARLPAQILKVAHHGGRYSSTPRFLSAVSPMAAVISVGAVNEYGHPTPQAIGRLERAHAHVYRTDQDGTVTVETDGARIELTTANGKREILRSR